jgi:hypothetical protein
MSEWGEVSKVQYAKYRKTSTALLFSGGVSDIIGGGGILPCIVSRGKLPTLIMNCFCKTLHDLSLPTGGKLLNSLSQKKLTLSSNHYQLKPNY